MKSLCISEFYGCIRAEATLEKFMVTMVVLVKVLVFNLLLQPHKFDSVNFPRGKQPLSSNMHIIASVYYRLTKHILRDYLDKHRPSYFKLGNWLKVKEEFIVECCEPLTFNVAYPDDNEWVSGLIT
jgi:hypothetical protein